jgi:hypothetical protein
MKKAPEKRHPIPRLLALIPAITVYSVFNAANYLLICHYCALQSARASAFELQPRNGVSSALRLATAHR